MGDSAQVSLDTIKKKTEHVFSPSFFGSYSFEYPYRVLLVYLSTNSNAVRAINDSNPHAFEHAFEEELRGAIEFVAQCRGITITDELLGKLMRISNGSLFLYLKSPMKNPPRSVAKSVAQAMDRQLAETLGDGERIVLQKVFEEVE